MAAAEPFWRRLEAGRALATPYQRFDSSPPGSAMSAARRGRPFIVVGFDAAGEPVFLWPFGRQQHGTAASVKFLGSKHANFNLDCGGATSRGDRRGRHPRYSRPRRHRRPPRRPPALFSQPLSWNGIANPFLLLPHQAAVDISARHNSIRPGRRDRDGADSSMRSRLRTKERKLQKLAGYRYIQAATAADIDRLLDAFFVQKARTWRRRHHQRVRRAGRCRVPARGLPRRLPDGRPLIELHALGRRRDAGDVRHHRTTIASRPCSTPTRSATCRQSPGLILLVHMVSPCADARLASFDIGVGRAHYKSFFCKEPEPLFDIFLPLTARGRLAALPSAPPSHQARDQGEARPVGGGAGAAAAARKQRR